MSPTSMQVTLQGIQALLAGPFHETIDVLRLQQLSLERVTKEELELLSKEFNCNKF